MNYIETVKRLESETWERTIKVDMGRYRKLMRYVYLEGDSYLEAIVDLIHLHYPQLCISEIWARVCPYLRQVKMHGREIPIAGQKLTAKEEKAVEFIEAGAQPHLVDCPTARTYVPVGFVSIAKFSSPIWDENGEYNKDHVNFYILRAVSD